MKLWSLLVGAALATACTAQSLDWWQPMVFYQIYPRSFKDSDGNGVGDLEGIRSKLEYFKELGVHSFWISPIYKSPMADFGYDISDFRDIDPIFGTMDDFKLLLQNSHDIGLKVIMDFVPNHSSDEHIWFQKSSNPSDPEYDIYKDYYVWKPPKENGDPPNNWASGFGGPAWEFNAARGEYYLHQFHKKQPDLNYRNPAVVEEMKNVLRFWLAMGIDGFRVDAIPTLFEDPAFPDYVEGQPSPTLHQPETYDMVYQWRTLLDEYSGEGNDTKVMMTEAYGDVQTMLLYQGNGTHNGAHFTFNFLVFENNLGGQSSPKDFNDTVGDWLNNIGDHWSNWVVGNHDRHRVAARFGVSMVDAMNMFTLMLPGTAVTYYGEEIGMEDNTAITYEQGVDPQGCQVENIEDFPSITRHFQRTPMQWDDTTSAGFSTNSSTWLPVHENYVTVNVEAQRAASHSHWKTYRKLIEARRTSVVQLGDTLINYVDTAWGFKRTLGTESYIGLMNLDSNNSAVVDVNLLFGDLPAVTDAYTGSAVHPEGSQVSSSAVMLEPKEGIVLYGNTARA